MLVDSAKALGFPLALLRLSLSTYRWKRHVSYAGRAAQVAGIIKTIIAGSTAATTRSCGTCRCTSTRRTYTRRGCRHFCLHPSAVRLSGVPWKLRPGVLLLAVLRLLASTSISSTLVRCGFGFALQFVLHLARSRQLQHPQQCCLHLRSQLFKHPDFVFTQAFSRQRLGQTGLGPPCCERAPHPFGLWLARWVKARRPNVFAAALA